MGERERKAQNDSPQVSATENTQKPRHVGEGLQGLCDGSETNRRPEETDIECEILSEFGNQFTTMTQNITGGKRDLIDTTKNTKVVKENKFYHWYYMVLL